MGFLGPVGIKIPLAIDHSVAAMPKVVVGGNAVDVHLTGVVPGRDFPLDRVLDLRNAEAGDPCPRCGTALQNRQGIEVGHVFKLGTKYSKAMGATFLDDKGAEIPLIMGCYGIGVNRIVAAAVEAGHDENGIVWPLPIAPYDVLLVPLQVQNPAVVEAMQSLEAQFEAAGLDVLVDDREQRPGVKFKDADLIGIPLRVVIGERGLKEGTIEVKWRTDSAAHTVPAESAGSTILAEIQARRQSLIETNEERRSRRAASSGR
jgi:prolyl-tRNA synthetase